MGLIGIKKIVGCENHVFINTDNGLWGMGNNLWGQLGLDYDNFSIHGLTKINFKYDIIDVYCDGRFSIINTTDGLYGCGNNISCQYGGKIFDHNNNFTKINIPNVIDVCCGTDFTLINTKDGLYGLGHIFSSVFDEIDNNIYKINIDGKVIKMCCDCKFALILTDDGLYCLANKWGIFNETFLKKLNFVDVVDIAAGFDYCIIKTKNGYYGFGKNNLRQIGFGDRCDYIDYNNPVKICVGATGDKCKKKNMSEIITYSIFGSIVMILGGYVVGVL